MPEPTSLLSASTQASPEARTAAQLLRSTTAVRARASALLARARRGESSCFAVHDAALPAVARLVAELTRVRYPDLKIPYHSRWRHFEAGGVNRVALLDAALGPVSAADKARAQIDLALVSVLLDAGAGPAWAYEERLSTQASSHRYTRSEGLGVASFHAFMAGLFSGVAGQPLQVDAAGLRQVTAEHLARAFQVSAANPLVGLEGRAALLRRLGEAMDRQPALFGASGRPGQLFALGADGALSAQDLLVALLNSLSDIWPAANQIDGLGLGDCWRHPDVAGEGQSRGWMPFHKLSQWLTYSLLEPFEWAGVKVTGLATLTGLPEYRNGGLFLDGGVLTFKNEAQARQTQRAGDPMIVEWRALTVALLDELAPLVREQLGLTAEQMPLACVLEGGTWAAGRLLAQQLRAGQPPLNIESDGTVF